MAKMFAMLVGVVLILVGILNFFVEPIKLLPAHGVIHIVAGVLGVWSAKTGRSAGYAMWVGIIGLFLAAVGFIFGAPTILDIVNLPTWISVIHLVLGIWGLWTYSAASKKLTPNSSSGMPPTSGTAM